MQLITFARILIWSACVGGLLVFLIEYQPVRELVVLNAIQFIVPNITADHLTNVAAYAKSTTEIWDAISALFVAVGAIIHREHYRVDRSLNGQWFWVSKIERDRRPLRAGWGEMIIHSIHDAQLRKEHPQQVIYGKTYSASDDSSAEGSLFQATEIVIGRASSQVLFFEWEYHDGFTATGVTKLKYFTKHKNGWFSRASSIEIRGAFMMDTSEGSGTIEFFETPEEANVTYTKEVANILVPQQEKAA
jgi:hypothetical protein